MFRGRWNERDVAIKQLNERSNKTAKAMAAFDCPDNIKPLTVPRLKQLARAYMDARVQRIYAGTNEIMKIIIAKQMDL